MGPIKNFHLKVFVFVYRNGRSWIMTYIHCAMPNVRSELDGRKSCFSLVSFPLFPSTVVLNHNCCMCALARATFWAIPNQPLLFYLLTFLFVKHPHRIFSLTHSSKTLLSHHLCAVLCTAHVFGSLQVTSVRWTPCCVWINRTDSVEMKNILTNQRNCWHSCWTTPLCSLVEQDTRTSTSVSWYTHTHAHTHTHTCTFIVNHLPLIPGVSAGNSILNSPNIFLSYEIIRWKWSFLVLSKPEFSYLRSLISNLEAHFRNIDVILIED